MMELRETELAVHRLLLKSLDELDVLSEEDWADQVEQLCRALLHLDPQVGRTLTVVVRAGAVIQQLLLDLVIRPPEGPPRQAIIDAACLLLDNLHNDDSEI